MSSAADIAQRLRSRILRNLHVGQVRPGDRLPSTRSLAEQLDEDHRAVAEAYHLLAADGLVEIRPRSGVYLARRERLAVEDSILRDTTRWVRDLAVEAWSRHVRLPDLCDLLGRCLSARRLACLCVESVRDPLTAVSEELTRDFGLAVEGALVPPPVEGPGGSSDCLPSSLVEKVEPADLVVTTAFHAAPLWSLLERSSLERPLVVVRVNPDWRLILQQAMKARGLTVVYDDPASADRFRLLLEAGDGDRLRFANVADRDRWARASGEEGAVYLTHAARKAADTGGLDILRPPSSLFSTEMTRELVEVMIRLNLQDRKA